MTFQTGTIETSRLAVKADRYPDHQKAHRRTQHTQRGQAPRIHAGHDLFIGTLHAVRCECPAYSFDGKSAAEDKEQYGKQAHADLAAAWPTLIIKISQKV